METAKNPSLAKVLLGCWTVQRIRGTSAYGQGTVPTDLTLSEGFSDRGTRTRHPITDAEGAGKANRWAKVCAEKVAKLPKADDALWDALAAMKPADLDSLIAHGVALSVSLDSELKGLTGKFLAALKFEMAEHFVPTADSYLGRVSKTLILQALTEAGKVTGAADKSRLEAMKKGELAAEAERRMGDSGWVPAVIRTGKAKQAVAKAKKRK
jgi:ParB family transcriptional regulator, chromosome partitioning protein